MLKPSERIKEITDKLCAENPDMARLSAHLWANEMYLDEEYVRIEKNHCDCHACPNEL